MSETRSTNKEDWAIYKIILPDGQRFMFASDGEIFRIRKGNSEPWIPIEEVLEFGTVKELEIKEDIISPNFTFKKWWFQND